LFAEQTGDSFSTQIHERLWFDQQNFGSCDQSSAHQRPAVTPAHFNAGITS
jgi:hypothetical protein